MKFLLLNILLLYIIQFGFAQTGPGGVGNKQNNSIWLSANRISDFNFINQSGTVTIESGSNIITGNSTFFSSNDIGKLIMISTTEGEIIRTISGVNSGTEIIVNLELNLSQSGIAYQFAFVGNWDDLSGNNNNAFHTNTDRHPSLINNAIDSKPVLRFDGINDALLFDEISDLRTAFIVVRANECLNSYTPFFGTTVGYSQYMQGCDQYVENTYTLTGWKNGDWYDNGSSINPNSTGVSTTDYKITSCITSVNVNTNLFCSDRYFAHRYFNGDIAEIIIYNIELNSAQRIIVDNYLSVKYNITIDNSKYSFLDTHSYDLAGIGKETDGVNSAARSGNILQISPEGEMSEGDYLLFAHNNDGFEEWQSDNSPEDIYRLSSTWKVSVTSTSNNLNIIAGINSELLPYNPSEDFVILISSDSDFSNADVYELTEINFLFYESESFTINNGDYIAIGLKDCSVNPGNVSYYATEIQNWQPITLVCDDATGSVEWQLSVNGESWQNIGSGSVFNANTIHEYGNIYRYRAKVTDECSVYSQYFTINENNFIFSNDVTCPSDACGTATASSSWGEYPPTHAFDNKILNDNCWASVNNSFSAGGASENTVWLRYDFGEDNEKIISKYSIRQRDYSSSRYNESPCDWKFQATNIENPNTNTDWETLHEVTGETNWSTIGTSPATNYYHFTNNTAYRYYRIMITRTAGSTTYTSIGEMEMMVELQNTDYAFKQGNIWYFGNQAGIDFNYDPPQAITNGVMSSREGCASICDQYGNLLFYTNGITVWNKNHNIMENGTGLLSPSTSHSTQSGVIVPKPGSNPVFYILSVPCAWEANTNDRHLRYAIVDISLQGGLGEVTNKNIELVCGTHGSYKTSERITAVRHDNGIDIWIIDREEGTNRFRAYLISDDEPDKQINTPVISEIGLISTVGSNLSADGRVGYLKASPDGTKLALATWGQTNAGFELFDFNSATGEISNTIRISDGFTYTNVGPYGIEFSPDGTKLYGSTHQDQKIYQWDLSADDITASAVEVGSTSGNAGALQLAPDGKIYVALAISSDPYGRYYLGVIKYPNESGTNCRYLNDYMYLEGKLSRQGLPNFIQTYLLPEDPLPVELMSFTARCNQSSTNQISWTTATEINNDYFILEKSRDAQNFFEIARIDGAGFSNTEINYSYTDRNAWNGDNYYRLTQVDFDGTSETFRIIHVNCDKDLGGEAKISVFPNPFRSEINILMENIKDDLLFVEIYDELGKMIYKEQISTDNSLHNHNINLQRLPSAVYNLRVVSERHLFNTRVVKQ